jgi:hypothetical protein
LTFVTWHKALLDKLLLAGSALLVAGLGVGFFALADRYHIPPVWIFALGIGGGFIVAVGRSLRSKFRQPLFVVFFVAWLVIHTLVTLLVIKFLTILWVWPASFLELWIGYAVAFWLFGLPPRGKPRSK